MKKSDKPTTLIKNSDITIATTQTNKQKILLFTFSNKTPIDLNFFFSFIILFSSSKNFNIIIH